MENTQIVENEKKLCVEDIREIFRNKLKREEFTTVNGKKTIEIMNASFYADDNSVFGKVDLDWNLAEIDWYREQSTNVNSIDYKFVPKGWKSSANEYGEVNSNYGRRLFSESCLNQFDKMVDQLVKDPTTRQAVAVYMPLDAHVIAVEQGKKDFICTFATQCLIRDNVLNYFVNMRSSDAVWGYKSDYLWHMETAFQVIDALDERDPDSFKDLENAVCLHWHASSFHVYEHHFDLIK